MSFQYEVVSTVIKLIEDKVERCLTESEHDDFNQIERNELSLDRMAEITGYSKWHLQRIFFTHTGLCIGHYIRRHILISSAFKLKKSNISIHDLSLKCGFSSQQAFTRSFLSLFKVTPARFRRMNEWDFSKIKPICLKEKYSITYRYVRVKNKKIASFKTYTATSCGEIFISTGTFPVNYFNFNITTSVYAVPYPESPSERKITLGFEQSFDNGNYISFEYLGSMSDYVRFFYDIYNFHFPKLGLIVQNGFFIEHHHSIKKKIHLFTFQF